MFAPSCHQEGTGRFVKLVANMLALYPCPMLSKASLTSPEMEPPWVSNPYKSGYVAGWGMVEGWRFFLKIFDLIVRQHVACSGTINMCNETWKFSKAPLDFPHVPVAFPDPSLLYADLEAPLFQFR